MRTNIYKERKAIVFNCHYSLRADPIDITQQLGYTVTRSVDAMPEYSVYSVPIPNFWVTTSFPGPSGSVFSGAVVIG